MMNKRIYKIIISVSVAAVMLALLSGCSSVVRSLDVIGNGSVTSFGEVLDALPGGVSTDETKNGWTFSAPDGTARFIWSYDWSISKPYDVMIEFDAQPFIDAGLDPDKLPENYIYKDNKLIVGIDFGDTASKGGAVLSPIEAYGQIVNIKASAIGYHSVLDHFGVSLGDGNMFEWAKNINANDKDMVFVLNPGPLITAGVNPESVVGWAFAKVKVHVDGKQTEVDKLLKPFNLK